MTTTALQAALDRGETIASLARSCGLDVRGVLEPVVDAEVADVEALAIIAGFGPDEVAEFAHELRTYLTSFVLDGEHVADARWSAGLGTAAMAAVG
ncbi:MAG TPA: hypothetical protein VIP77_14080 [Jiangellaceae bacterium]